MEAGAFRNRDKTRALSLAWLLRWFDDRRGARVVHPRVERSDRRPV